MNQFLVGRKTLVIAHRGSSAYAPENTLAAFELAAEQGADAVELDAKLTVDQQVVVIHDDRVDRTTNGKGVVRRMSLGELKALDAGSSFASRFSGETIPTLAEVFDAVGSKLLINVELKNYDSPNDNLVPRVVELVKQFHLEERILFSSFHPGNLIRAHSLLPETPVAILAIGGRAGWWTRSFLLRHISPEFVHPYYKDASPSYLERQHGMGRKVNVWTVNDRADLLRLARDGADGLITNDPVAACEMLAELDR